MVALVLYSGDMGKDGTGRYGKHHKKQKTTSLDPIAKLQGGRFRPDEVPRRNERWKYSCVSDSAVLRFTHASYSASPHPMPGHTLPTSFFSPPVPHSSFYLFSSTTFVSSSQSRSTSHSASRSHFCPIPFHSLLL